MRVSLTEIHKTTKNFKITEEDRKAAEYVFKTHYGYFPRMEDSVRFIPVVEFVHKEWVAYYKRKTQELRYEFFHELLEKNIKAKEGETR